MASDEKNDPVLSLLGTIRSQLDDVMTMVRADRAKTKDVALSPKERIDDQ